MAAERVGGIDPVQSRHYKYAECITAIEAVAAHLEEVGHPLPMNEIVKGVMGDGFRSGAPFTDLLIQTAAATFLLDPVPTEHAEMSTELEVLHMKRHRAEQLRSALNIEIECLEWQIKDLAGRLLGES
jgi:hypothetical protein